MYRFLVLLLYNAWLLEAQIADVDLVVKDRRYCDGWNEDTDALSIRQPGRKMCDADEMKKIDNLWRMFYTLYAGCTHVKNVYIANLELPRLSCGAESGDELVPYGSKEHTFTDAEGQQRPYSLDFLSEIREVKGYIRIEKLHLQSNVKIKLPWTRLHTVGGVRLYKNHSIYIDNSPVAMSDDLETGLKKMRHILGRPTPMTARPDFNDLGFHSLRAITRGGIFIAGDSLFHSCFADFCKVIQGPQDESYPVEILGIPIQCTGVLPHYNESLTSNETERYQELNNKLGELLHTESPKEYTDSMSTEKMRQKFCGASGEVNSGSQYVTCWQQNVPQKFSRCTEASNCNYVGGFDPVCTTINYQEQCCHDSCTSGCSTPNDPSACFSCAYFYNPATKRCQNTCPGRYTLTPITLQVRKAPEDMIRYHYDSQCVKDCPKSMVASQEAMVRLLDGTCDVERTCTLSSTQRAYESITSLSLGECTTSCPRNTVTAACNGKWVCIVSDAYKKPIGPTLYREALTNVFSEIGNISMKANREECLGKNDFITNEREKYTYLDGNCFVIKDQQSGLGYSLLHPLQPDFVTENIHDYSCLSATKCETDIDNCPVFQYFRNKRHIEGDVTLYAEDLYFMKISKAGRTIFHNVETITGSLTIQGNPANQLELAEKVANCTHHRRQNRDVHSVIDQPGTKEDWKLENLGDIFPRLTEVYGLPRPTVSRKKAEPAISLQYLTDLANLGLNNLKRVNTSGIVIVGSPKLEVPRTYLEHIVLKDAKILFTKDPPKGGGLASSIEGCGDQQFCVEKGVSHKETNCHHQCDHEFGCMESEKPTACGKCQNKFKRFWRNEMLTTECIAECQRISVTLNGTVHQTFQQGKEQNECCDVFQDESTECLQSPCPDGKFRTYIPFDLSGKPGEPRLAKPVCIKCADSCSTCQDNSILYEPNSESHGCQNCSYIEPRPFVEGQLQKFDCMIPTEKHQCEPLSEKQALQYNFGLTPGDVQICKKKSWLTIIVLCIVAITAVMLALVAAVFLSNWKRASHADYGPLVLDERDLEIGELLGKGYFGTVYRGICTVPNNDKSNWSKYNLGLFLGDKEKKFEVAIKKMRFQNLQHFQQFMDEARSWCNIHHKYLVKLMAVVMRSDHTMLLVAELVEGGCIKDFMAQLLKTEGVIKANTILRWLKQIAGAMAYLGKRKIVHRDLAARNILVKNKAHVVVSDFGLSKTWLPENKGSTPASTTTVNSMVRPNSAFSEMDNVVDGTEINPPWRWNAPECSQGIYNTKTDIYAYGVTVWEILTRCEHRPFDDCLFVIDLPEDRILRRPKGICHKAFAKYTYEACMKSVPSNRPDFEIMVQAMKYFMEYDPKQEYVQNMRPVKPAPVQVEEDDAGEMEIERLLIQHDLFIHDIDGLLSNLQALPYPEPIEIENEERDSENDADVSDDTSYQHDYLGDIAMTPMDVETVTGDTVCERKDDMRESHRTYDDSGFPSNGGSVA